ncbi:MAG: hypothetical protein Q7U73_01635 [Rubrivivax sp.]|nr:hypothetical protein [Rubrivivax sp.]
MRHPFPLPRRPRPAAWPALLAFVVDGAAAADGAALHRCRAIADTTARLAC